MSSVIDSAKDEVLNRPHSETETQRNAIPPPPPPAEPALVLDILDEESLPRTRRNGRYDGRRRLVGRNGCF